MAQPDFLVVGAGVIGIAVARELKAAFGDAKITVVEKEPAPARHASGRNSGVLHAGFYYTADSLKAKFTRQGNEFWRAFCAERGLKINPCGKLVLPRGPEEFGQVDELLKRAKTNAVDLTEVDDKQALEIEPRARVCGRALWSPLTASVDPVEVIGAMEKEVTASGVQIKYNERVIGHKSGTVTTTAGKYTPRYVVNAAGLYADVVAKTFGFSKEYAILPFKGIYLYGAEPQGAFRTNIYPVPDLRNPFLGVHFTLTVDGHVKIGPTAIPAFWRENYKGFDNFSLSELVPILAREAALFTTAGFDFRSLALSEVRKYSRRRMVSLASALATGVSPAHFPKWGKAGIRAQLLDVRTRKLEMDFVIQSDDRSLHVLNAVSPAFTASIPFARHVVAMVKEHVKR